MESVKNSKTNEKKYFQFQKVEDYFQDTLDWHMIARMKSYDWDYKNQTLAVHLETEEGLPCVMLFQIVTGSVMRVRFHPDRKEKEEYEEGNTRAVVLDTFQELADKNRTEQYWASVEEKFTTTKIIEVSFHGSKVERTVSLQISYEPFAFTLLSKEDLKTETFFQTSSEGLKFKKAGEFDDYHIIQTVRKPATAKYVGFGEQGGIELVKNNSCITYFNYDNMRYRQVYNHGPFEEREPLYHSDPFFMEVNSNAGSSSAYGIFVDNPSEVLMDMGYYKSTEYAFGIRYGDMDYYIMSGDNCADIIKSFSNIVGTARLVPRYALGYHQGCYGYESREDVESVVEKYRKYHIPLDGVHIDVDLQQDYKTFTIDEKKFPNPKEMFSSLRQKGVKCSTNITPIISNKNAEYYNTYQEGIKNGYFIEDLRYNPENPDGKTYYKYASGVKYEYAMGDKEGQYNSGKPFIGEVYYGNEGSVELGTTGHYPDLNRKEVRKWWGKQYQYLFDMGLEMVWQDMTTPCLRDTRGDMLSFPSRLLVYNDFIKHYGDEGQYDRVPVMRVWNLYSYNLHKATYHGLNNLQGRENKRNFIIGRGCFTGMHRFAGLWTGDNSSNWEFLQINISQVLALGLTGQALSGQDIGGFERENDWEKWADPELLIRWTAMGAFLPWFRNHYIRKGKKSFQEPYEYQFHVNEVPEETRYLYHSVLPVCKYYIELRYTLLQIFYDAMFENTINGMPICRAMFLTNPEDEALFNDKASFLNTQFMVRNDLLVAPVLEKQSVENDFGKRDVYLPYGNNWYQFKNHKSPLQPAIEGGTTISGYDASICSAEEHIPFIVPLFVKEGAILPVLELEEYVGEKNGHGKPNPITLYIYPGLKGSYTMYLDDGVSRSSQPAGDSKYGVDTQAKGEYREVSITHSYQSVHRRQIRMERIHDGYTPKYEDYVIISVLHKAEEEKNPVKLVQINSKKVCNTAANLEQLKQAEGAAWYYEERNHATYIKVPDNAGLLIIDLLYQGGDDNYFAGGDGTRENPYKIANAEQLAILSDLTENYSELYAGAHYIVTADIDTDSCFKSIGSSSYPFTGSLDAGIYNENGNLVGLHTIKLHLQGENAGLFGVLGNDSTKASLSNLKLDGTVLSTAKSVGGVVGSLYSGSITNVILADTMVVQGPDTVGGVAGHSYGGEVRNCISYASVKGNNAAGGIAGYNAHILEQCCNAGEVQGKLSAGGIAGTSFQSAYSTTTIKNCLNVGKVNISQSTANSFGGIGGSALCYTENNCSLTPMPVFGSGTGSNNYYYAAYDIDPSATRKETEDFENGSVTALLNKTEELWEQGTVPGVSVEKMKVYPVLKFIHELL